MPIAESTRNLLWPKKKKKDEIKNMFFYNRAPSSTMISFPQITWSANTAAVDWQCCASLPSALMRKGPSMAVTHKSLRSAQAAHPRGSAFHRIQILAYGVTLLLAAAAIYVVVSLV